MTPSKTGPFCAVAIIGGVLFGLFSGFAGAQSSASIFIAPPTGTFTVGSTFTVSIYLNTGGNSINAVEANLTFPPDKLQVVSPTAGKSLVQVWISQPTFSNTEGTLKFRGAIPSPGINTESGLVSTVTFRVKATGLATIRISDTSQVLLNDGRGTNILGETGGSLYQLTLPPPGGPLVTSPTNPDQETWYPTKNLAFRWESEADTQGFSYILNDLPVDEPDDISEGLRESVGYRDLADGVYYFHIKRVRSGIWGGITHHKAQIDNTPPAAFEIQFSPGGYTSNRRPIVEFRTTDAVSGINHYELKFISLDTVQASESGGSTPFFIEAISPYSQNLEIGRYEVVVRAFDGAGNFYQSSERLTITHPVFEIVRDKGLRVGGVYTLSWPYVWVVGAILLLLSFSFARGVWIWHRRIEKQLETGPQEHPSVSPKLADLREKQAEYGKGKGMNVPTVIALLLASALILGARAAHAQGSPLFGENLAVEPPIVTLFPKFISNDEIFYIGGRAGAPESDVLIYIQGVETGTTFSQTIKADKVGAWFYSLPQFLNSGRYLIWTQLRWGDVLSPPSSRMDLLVAPTAIQLGGSRLSYQSLYLIFTVALALVLFGILIFIGYHSYHARLKNRKLLDQIREAEDSIRRGFLLLRKDIEGELAFIRGAKLKKELSEEEKRREEKLLRDFEAVSDYVGKEVWEIERLEKGA